MTLPTCVCVWGVGMIDWVKKLFTTPTQHYHTILYLPTHTNTHAVRRHPSSFPPPHLYTHAPMDPACLSTTCLEHHILEMDGPPRLGRLQVDDGGELEEVVEGNPVRVVGTCA